MLKSFLEAKQSSILQISTVTPNSDRFRQLVNDATDQLLTRGDWPGTVVPLFTCVKKGCVVWPRWVGEVRMMNICRRGHVDTKNSWWSFIPHQNGWRDAWCGRDQLRMINESRSPVHTDIFGEGRTVRAYPSTPLDNNKTITIFGIGNDGQELFTKGLGGWTPGLELVLKLPFVETTVYVRSISRVLKDPTEGPVNIYGWNGTTREPLAQYAPSETNPDYLRTCLQIPSCILPRNQCATSTPNPCPESIPIIAEIKAQFIPVELDTDVVLIENLRALKKMIQSNLFDDSGDFENARKYELDAVRELNYQVRNENPRWQIPVNVNGSGNQRAMKIGTLI